MATCPACGAEVPSGGADCPGCHLSTGLFAAVLEAAGPNADPDPAYVRTVAELLRSIDLDSPVAPAAPPLLRPSAGSHGPGTLELPKGEPARQPSVVLGLSEIPRLPSGAHGDALRARAEEYLRLARRLGLDLTSISARVAAARLSDDEPALDAAVREAFVHVASALAVSFDVELARRNEIAQLVPTPSADVELNAVRVCLAAGNLAGAEMRLSHVRDEIGRLEDIWATSRILTASCEMLVETIVELGGDPAPAVGPLQEGRRLLSEGKPDLAERVLARTTVALWALLEGRFFEELKRVRDRLLELRQSGADVAPALAELRAISTELGRRNFVGTIVGYRSLRERLGPAEPEVAAAAVAEPGAAPPSPPT
jgi:hypothetical protein